MEKMAQLYANSEDPDQRPHSAASDLGLHYLSVTLLGVFRLQWVNSGPVPATQFSLTAVTVPETSGSQYLSR